MAYAVIELLSLNFALNPLFCKTDVLVAQLRNKDINYSFKPRKNALNN